MRTIPNNVEETFDFQIEGTDEVYSLPMPRYLPAVQIQRLNAILRMPDGPDKDAASTDILMGLLRDSMGDAVDTLTMGAVEAIFEAWQNVGGEELGE